MKKILIVSGHPDLENDSLANRTILEEYAKLLPEAEIARLDTLYPDFAIDAAAEQARLVKADIVVLQFPLFWYSMPSLLHRWVEKTFVHGFSHGSKGDKLAGKTLLLSITAGAPESMFVEGPKSFPLEAYMVPFKSIAGLCQMKWAGYVFTGGVSYALRTDPKLAAEVVDKARGHAVRVRDVLATL